MTSSYYTNYAAGGYASAGYTPNYTPGYTHPTTTSKPTANPYTSYRPSPSSYTRERSLSPPESRGSTSSSGSLYSSVKSRDYAASLAGSDYESSSSSHGAASVDLLDYMNARLSDAYDPTPMDRTVVRQAQLSGQLNAKNRELLELQAEARRRLDRTRLNFAEGMKAARETRADLEWSQKKVAALNARAAYKYPEQYRAARELYPEREEY